MAEATNYPDIESVSPEAHRKQPHEASAESTDIQPVHGDKDKKDNPLGSDDEKKSEESGLALQNRNHHGNMYAEDNNAVGTETKGKSQWKPAKTESADDKSQSEEDSSLHGDDAENTYELRFDREKTYFPSDVMEGTFAVDATAGALHLKNLRMIAVCDVAFRDTLGLMWSDRIIREYTKVECDPIQKGESRRIPVQLTLPDTAPPSLSSRIGAAGKAHREVTWEVRMVCDDENNNGRALDSHPFIVGTAYEPAMAPKANAWRRTLVSGKRRLNVDVRLTKNVYYEDEDVVVIVDVNNETGDKIKSISAKLFQKVVLKAPHKVPVTKEQMLAKAKVKEGLPGPNSDGEVEVRVAPTVPDNNNDVCIRDVSKNDSALEKSASFTVETGSGDPSPAHDCKRSLAPTVFFTDPRPERPESLKVSFHVSYSVLVTVSRGHGMGKKIEIQLPFTLGDNVDNMEVTPRRHKSGSLITSSHKSLLSMVGLGVTKEVQALSAYGEEDIVEEQNQQREAKQLEKEEKKAAKQRQADEKEELRAMREKQKQAKRDLRKSRDDLSKSTSKSITPQPNTAGLQDVSRAKMLSPVPKTTEEEVKEKAVDAQYEHQHEARDDGVIMDAKL